jgi:putative endonuclease
MFYVYILKSLKKDWHYVGFTTELKSRFDDHNQGKVESTRYHRPFKMASYIAVESKEFAINLEK